MANPFEYVSTNQLKIGGVELYFDDGNTDALFRNKNRDDAYYMAKSRGYLQTYEFINATFPGATGTGLNILELGIFSGGSTVFFDCLSQETPVFCGSFPSSDIPASRIYCGFPAEPSGTRLPLVTRELDLDWEKEFPCAALP